MQSEETAPVVRQTNIRRLVIRIGTDTNKNTHTLVKRRIHADVFAQSVFGHTCAHTCEHIKDENTPS